MTVRIRVEPIERDIQVLLASDLSAEGRSRQIAAFAREQLEQALATNSAALGRAPDYEAYVDGRRNAPLESVRPDGRIVFEFDILLDLFAWIADQLRRHSPVGRGGDRRVGHPGLYRASHTFYADDVEADVNEPPDAEEYVFVSTVPYARKIERGLSRQSPDGVFQVVATLASRRFGNVARIRFGYRVPLGGDLNAWANRTSLTRRGRRMSEAARHEWLRRQPAIIVSPR